MKILNLKTLKEKTDLELFMIAAEGTCQRYAYKAKYNDGSIDLERYEEECVLQIYTKGLELKRLRNRKHDCITNVH